MVFNKKERFSVQVTMICRDRGGWIEAKKENEKESYA